jgi:hypothetical protein
MKRGLCSALLAVAIACVTRDASALGTRRVLVGGREGDALTERVHKELVAMGFDVVRIDSGEGCSRSAVSARIREAAAHAATCTDGDAIGVWINEPSGLRLRDVIVARTPDDQQRDMAAVRAAETARASIELVDAEAEAKAQGAAKPASPPPPPPGPPAAAPQADRGVGAAPKKDVKRVPTFLAGVGFSTVMGVDASVTAFSAESEIGITSWLAIAPRLDLPIEDHNLFGSPSLKVRPGFTGIAAMIPVARTTAFVIPRFGAGFGGAWIHAQADPTTTTRLGQNGFTETFPTSTGGTDTTWSLAAYGTAALSMRIVGPMRMTVDGIFGSTFSRLVVETQNVHRAYWGTPFGALALRLEAMFP